MSERLTLIIGNKNYSSWSLRPWILLKYYQIPFKETLIPLYTPESKAHLLKHSPNGKVPALHSGDFCIWESLAICEYIAEAFKDKKIWPEKASDRAWARSVASEMHAGFGELRHNMPMNLKARHPGKGKTPAVEADIKRISEIWNDCRNNFKDSGPFLFGNFTVADAMFAPVVTRYRTYGVSLDGLAQEYAKTMLELPAFKEWEEAAVKESWVIEASEIYV